MSDMATIVIGSDDKISGTVVVSPPPETAEQPSETEQAALEADENEEEA